MSKLNCLAVGVFLGAVSLGAAAGAELKPPKLVLQITVDQLRADLPRRYMHRMGKGGFRYFYDKGVVYENAQHNHANTETIVGHATLATGATPATHGMIGNVWFDRDDGRLVYNIEDADYPLLDESADVDKDTEIDPTQKTAATSGRSPQKIRVTTFSDELHQVTGGEAKVFGVSVKDRGAVSLAGHAGKAFWFSKANASFVTSSYYYSQYPEWVKGWNASGKSQAYAGTSWELAGDIGRYFPGVVDDQSWEVDFPGFGRVFPHAFGDAAGKYYTTLLTLSPAGDELTADFAKALLVEEGLGQDAVTDYLSVSFSSTDYVGHIFGSASVEMEDNLIRLDQTLESLLQFVDKQVGLKNTLIVLSADHGGADAAPYAAKQGLNAHYIDPKAWSKKEAFAVLNDRFKVSESLIKTFSHPYIYLDYDVIKKNKLDADEVAALVSDEVAKLPGVAIAVSSEQIASGALPSTEPYNSIVNNHNPTRSGDVFIVFEPHSFINDMEGLVVSATHGSPWRYDTHVPVIFAGNGLRPKRVFRRIDTVDVAPTLSARVGANMPSGTTGEVLVEVLDK